MRLQKYMAQCGVASRRKSEEYIQDGRVKVNGKVVMELGTQIDPANDRVTVDGHEIALEDEKKYILFYKPPCVMCTTSDPEGRKTVFEYVEGIEARLFTVGRLDYLSEGLLLLTNDGELANALSHPSREIDKTYLVRCRGEVTEGEAERLQTGVTLDDGTVAAGRVRLLESGEVSTLNITIHEGRNRQVRRMMEAIGHEVLFLKREKYATLTLHGLKKGKWRELREDEVRDLMRLSGLVQR